MSHKAVHESEMALKRVPLLQVLAVVTSCDAFPDGTPTGLWLSELADAFYEFQAAGCDMTIASPKGGAVPLDPASLEPGALTEPARRFMADPETKQLLEHSVPLASISDDASAYDALFFPGGHGPLLDLARDGKAAALASAAFAAGKTVAAVCHGPAGLLGARDGARPLVAGRRVAAFTAEEERAVGRRDKAPYMLDERLAELGAQVSRGPALEPRLEVDGRLVTGQNPASTAAVAQAAVRVMEVRAAAGQ